MVDVFNISSTASSYTVQLPLVDDTVVEDDERFRVSLSVVGEQGGVRVGGDSIATITISDDDSEYTRHLAVYQLTPTPTHTHPHKS